jgi:hypothetical protein
MYFCYDLGKVVRSERLLTMQHCNRPWGIAGLFDEGEKRSTYRQEV